MTRIIVTNDDGVHAPGVLALAQAMRTLGEVHVAAPARNQSATGHKKTLFQDIAVHDVTLADGTIATSVEGSPADCIALCALGLTAWPPDLVVSGINRGSNMAQDITYSGTVTAALESAINGAPAVAVSLDSRDADTVEDYAEAARVAVEVVKMALQKPIPLMTILNLNVPNVPRVNGLRLTRQGVRIYRDELHRDGNILRIQGPEPIGEFQHEATDVWAIHHGYASLTPIHLDMTAHRFMADLAAWDLTV
ncbi:MAG: 5'-nucleotidase [Chloroflexi bacterium OLB15]|nr:MAG: 5'-nucleotidase [Chloroflexi bacterium OLB15]